MLLQLALVALANAALLASWIMSKSALVCWELAALAMIFGILAIRIEVRSHQGRRISPGSLFVVFAALAFVVPIWGRHAGAAAVSGDEHRDFHAHAIWRIGHRHWAGAQDYFPMQACLVRAWCDRDIGLIKNWPTVLARHFR